MPEDILAFFSNDDQAVAAPLGSGMVNSTWSVHSKDRGLFVLQRLNPIFNERLMEDYGTISQLLTAAHWEVPQLLSTLAGEPYCRAADGSLWRALSFIDSEPVDLTALSAETFTAVGALLAAFHKTLAEIDYTPVFVLPHFHDTAYYVGRLHELTPHLPDARTKALSQRLLTALDELPILPDAPEQLVHGDPQLTNLLFHGGRPFTLIDLDTVMLGSIWVDLGDLLRSLLQDGFRIGDEADLQAVQAIIDGYYDGAAAVMDHASFTKSALQAGRRIAIELAIRFLNDIVDDNYFTWDKKRFTSRRDNHLSEIDLQWRIFKTLEVAL